MAQGPQGLRGPQGAKGDKGDPGATGSRGLTGQNGLPGHGAGPVVMAYNSINQNLSVGDNINTVLKYSTTTVNTNNYYNTLTGTFTPLVAGYYQVNVSMVTELVSGSPGGSFFIYLSKNGVALAVSTPVIATVTMTLNTLVYFNGTTDYITITLQSAIATGVWRTQISEATYFQAVWIRGRPTV